MSGWIAIVDRRGGAVDTATLDARLGSLQYRGRDHDGRWSAQGVGLAHALHQTTPQDVPGAQPAHRHGGLSVVGDVRLDAREELVRRLGLESRVDLAVIPDVELVLHAYAHWGSDLCEYLRGDFGFALWDANRRALICATDHFGKRAVYWAEVGDRVFVSNSVPCLLTCAGVSDRPDPEAMADFLLTGMHGALDARKTAHRDIHAIPPAHRMVVGGGARSLTSYWAFPVDMPQEQGVPIEEQAERLRDALQLAVDERLRSAGAVVAMSGGMDSTSIAALACSTARRDGLDLHAATVLFDTLPLPRERPFVEAAVSHLGLPLDVVRGDAFGLLEPALPTTRPIEVITPAMWLAFDECVASRARVVLTGKSADNVLCNSPALQVRPRASLWRTAREVLRMRQMYGTIPSLGTGLLASPRQDRLRDFRAVFAYPQWLAPRFEAEFDTSARWRAWTAQSVPPAVMPRGAWVERSLTSFPWNLEDLYRPTGVVAPEERDPYLDLRVLALAIALPPLPAFVRKHALRTAMRDALPSAVLERPKEGLGYYHDVLLRAAPPTTINAWRGAEALEDYVVRDRVPSLGGGRVHPDASAGHLRPRLLDAWLRTRGSAW